MKKHFGKKTLCLMLTLCLCTGFAAAESGSANLYTMVDYADINAKSVRTVAAIGEWLYLLALPQHSSDSSIALERWQAGMDAPETVYSDLLIYVGEDGESYVPVVSRLFTDGKALYGYDEYTAQVTLLMNESGEIKPEKLYTLDISALSHDAGEYREVGDVNDLFIQDGAIYLLTVTWADAEEKRIISSYNLSDGTLKAQVEAKGVSTLCGYKDGKLLAAGWPGGNNYDEETYEPLPMSLTTVDPATGDAQVVLETKLTSCTGLRYDAATDTAYVSSAATVYSFPGLAGEGEISAWLPTAAHTGSGQGFALTTNNLYAFATYNGLYVRELNLPGVSDGALVIYNEYGSTKHNAVVAAHPEWNITVSQQYFDGIEGLTTAMVSGGDTIDVLRLYSTSNPLERLIQKGYCADLSGYPEIVSLLDRMAEGFTSVVKKDGKIYGVPVEVSGDVLAYKKETLEELGLSESDLPTNLPDFLDFVANFYYDYGEEHPDISLMDNLMMRDRLFSLIMDQYVAYQTKTSGVISFDTELFRKLLTALDAIDFTELDPYAVLGNTAWEDDSINEFYEKNSLLGSYFSISPTIFSSQSAYLPLVLSLDEGIDPVIPVQLSVLTVNPRSTHMDQAAAYIAEYAANYDEQAEGVMLFPGNNEPVLNPYYEMTKQSIEQSIESVRTRLEKADESEKASLREELKSLEDEYATIDDTRVSLTSENIDAYRQKLAPYLYAASQTPLTDYSSEAGGELQTLISQYRDGAIDTDAFIREMDKRVRMMMLEDQ